MYARCVCDMMTERRNCTRNMISSVLLSNITAKYTGNRQVRRMFHLPLTMLSVICLPGRVHDKTTHCMFHRLMHFKLVHVDPLHAVTIYTATTVPCFSHCSTLFSCADPIPAINLSRAVFHSRPKPTFSLKVFSFLVSLFPLSRSAQLRHD